MECSFFGFVFVLKDIVVAYRRTNKLVLLALKIIPFKLG